MNQSRLLDFVRKNLEARFASVMQEPNSADTRRQLERVVAERLAQLADELQVELPKIESFVDNPGTISFRFLGRLDPKMHAALWVAGLLGPEHAPPPPPYISLTFEISAAPTKEEDHE